MKRKQLKLDEQVKARAARLAFDLPTLTVGQLREQLESIGIPDDAILTFTSDYGWRAVKHMSYFRAMGQIKLW